MDKYILVRNGSRYWVVELSKQQMRTGDYVTTGEVFTEGDQVTAWKIIEALNNQSPKQEEANV